jgi:hypothetical protein
LFSACFIVINFSDNLLTSSHSSHRLTGVKEEVMARSDTRYSIYPAPKAVEIVGASAPALNQAVECWAALLLRAMADNSDNIWPVNPGGSLAPGELHFLHEWCVLAEALRGKQFEPDFAKPGDLLAATVEDAHRLERVGDKWFTSETDGEMHAKGLASSVRELVEKLHRLDYAAAWAVIVAVQWFWDHQNEGIDMREDLWWTLAFRRQWHQKRTGIKDEAVTTDLQREGKRRNRKTPPTQ